MRVDLLDHRLLQDRGDDLDLTAILHWLRLPWSRQIERSRDSCQSERGKDLPTPRLM
jgi:hypothetical protein